MDQVGLRDYCAEVRLLIQSGETDKAILNTRHILSHYPQFVECYRLLGQALLAARNYRQATRQFHRVLSAAPDDVESRVGLAKLHETTSNPDRAIWHMQRAVELSPGDSNLRTQLGQLINAHQKGSEGSELLELTRAALGHIYTRRGLYAKAIQEFNAVLSQNPTRLDVQTTLAEALWQAGRPLESVEVSQLVLKKLPNALKANLFVGAALCLDNPQSREAEPYLRLAQALDPENIVAQSLFGASTPLLPSTVKIERLGEFEIESAQFQPPPTVPAESAPAVQEREPAIDWMGEMHQEEMRPMSDEKRPDEEYEPLPDWLQGVGDDFLEEDQAQPAASSATEQESSESDETPAWLRDLVSRTEDPDAIDETPLDKDELPEWPQESQSELAEDTSAGVETPDWLASIAAGQPLDDREPESAPSRAEPSRAPSTSEADQVDRSDRPEEAEEPAVSREVAPEPIAGLETEAQPTSERALPEEVAEEAPVEGAELPFLEPLGEVVEETEVPDWLREIMAGETLPTDEGEPVAATETLPEVPVDEAGLPDWLRGTEEPEAQPVSPEVAGEPTTSAEEGRALWEQILAEEGIDLASAEEAPPPEALGMSAEEWLRSTAGLEAAPSGPTTSEPLAEEPPVEEREVPVAPIEADVEEVTTPFPVEDAEPSLLEPLGEAVEEPEVPDWLQETLEPVAADTEGEEAEVPDWLRDYEELAAETELPPEAEVVADVGTEVADELEEAVEVEVDEAGLPEWLREPPVEEAAELPEPEAAPSTEMPEWLTELEAEETLLTASTLEEPVDLETGEMPEWLGEIMAGEPPLPETWAAEAEATEPLEPEVQEGQVPEWLRDFHEREAAKAMEPEAPPEAEVEPVAATEAEVEPEDETQPELPDWLHRLREGVPESEAPEPEELPAAEAETPVEVEATPPSEMPPEPELAELEAAGPEWLGELVPAEEGLAELEELAVVEEELAPAAAPSPEVPEPESAEAVGTAELEALRVEDLPKDPAARLSMARAALNAGDWLDALTIYETLISSSEMLDSVIDNLNVGVRRHPNDPAGYQLLGDACMKDGRLQDALQAYRTALAKL